MIPSANQITADCFGRREGAPHMLAKLKFAMLASVVSLALSGCRCAPKELFSWIDRHGFVADWTSHYNCVNRTCYGGHCQQPATYYEGEVLVLGDAAAPDQTIE